MQTSAVQEINLALEAFLIFCLLVSSLARQSPECPAANLLCPCGHGPSSVSVSVARCWKQLGKTVTCEPCDGLSDGERCSHWQKCSSCSTLDQCATCPNGKFGTWCEKDCFCRNGGTCLWPNGECDCLPSFSGRFCEIEVSTKRLRKTRVVRKRATTEGCQKPTDPENGKALVEFDTSSAGDAVKYKCKLGYTMIGSATRHCLENGRWTGEKPTCEKLCSFPTIRNQGGLTYTENPGRKDSLRDTSGNVVLSEIEFSCMPGYTLSGPAKIRCVSGGKWDRSPPACVQSGMSQCPEPGKVQHGRQRPETAASYPSGSILHFECDAGYVMSGAPVIVCTDGGTWSSNVPHCALSGDTSIGPKVTTMAPTPGTVSCKEPRKLDHGSFKITLPNADMSRPNADALFEKGTSVEYECDHPFVLDGIGEQYCLATGVWSGRQPSCRPDCGKGVEPKAPQVINGSIAVQHGYPWQVALTTYSSRAEFRFIHCGGVVLHESWVLTAAHCLTKQSSKEVLPPESFLLFFGKHYADRNIDDNNVVARKVSQLIVHPKYNPWTFDSDLGLVHLEEELSFNAAVIPLCLPEPNSLASFQEGRNGVVAGWGYTDRNQTEARILMTVELPIVGNDKCEESYKKQKFRATVTENMYCAGFDEGGKNTCQGDSGGAMAFYERDRYVLEGIVSWGNKDDCAAPGSYGGFVRVRNFVHWINSYVPQ